MVEQAAQARCFSPRRFTRSCIDGDASKSSSPPSKTRVRSVGIVSGKLRLFSSFTNSVDGGASRPK